MLAVPRYNGGGRPLTGSAFCERALTLYTCGEVLGMGNAP